MDQSTSLTVTKTARLFFQYKMKIPVRRIISMFQSCPVELKKINEFISSLEQVSHPDNSNQIIVGFLNQKDSVRFHPFLIQELFKCYGFTVSLKKASADETKKMIIELLTEKIEDTKILQTFNDSSNSEVLSERTEFIQSDVLADATKKFTENSQAELSKHIYGHLYRIIQMPWEKIKLNLEELKYIQALRNALIVNDESEISAALQNTVLISSKPFNPQHLMLQLLALHIDVIKNAEQPKSAAVIADIYYDMRRYFFRLFPINRVDLDVNKVSLADVTKWTVHNPYNRKFTDCNLKLYGSYDHYLSTKDDTLQRSVNNDQYASCKNENEFNEINDKSYKEMIEAPARAIVKTLYNHHMRPFYSNAGCEFLHKGVWWQNPNTNQFFFSSFAHQQTYKMITYKTPGPHYQPWLVFWKNPISLPFDLPWPKLEIFLTSDIDPTWSFKDEDGVEWKKFALIDHVYGEDEKLEHALDGSEFWNFSMV